MPPFSDMFPHGDRAASVVSSCKLGNAQFKCVKRYFSVLHTLRSDYSIKWYLLTIGSARVYHEARRRISYPFVVKDLSKKSASHFGLAYLKLPHLIPVWFHGLVVPLSSLLPNVSLPTWVVFFQNPQVMASLEHWVIC